MVGFTSSHYSQAFIDSTITKSSQYVYSISTSNFLAFNSLSYIAFPRVVSDTITNPENGGELDYVNDLIQNSLKKQFIVST